MRRRSSFLGCVLIFCILMDFCSCGIIFLLRNYVRLNGRIDVYASKETVEYALKIAQSNEKAVTQEKGTLVDRICDLIREEIVPDPIWSRLNPDKDQLIRWPIHKAKGLYENANTGEVTEQLYENLYKVGPKYTPFSKKSGAYAHPCKMEHDEPEGGRYHHVISISEKSLLLNSITGTKAFFIYSKCRSDGNLAILTEVVVYSVATNTIYYEGKESTDFGPNSGKGVLSIEKEETQKLALAKVNPSSEAAQADGPWKSLFQHLTQFKGDSEKSADVSKSKGTAEKKYPIDWEELSKKASGRYVELRKSELKENTITSETNLNELNKMISRINLEQNISEVKENKENEKISGTKENAEKSKIYASKKNKENEKINTSEERRTEVIANPKRKNISGAESSKGNVLGEKNSNEEKATKSETKASERSLKKFSSQSVKVNNAKPKSIKSKIVHLIRKM